ncbi:MAG: hypothetical protein ACKVPX_13105 [Myxococcaceae bacterium]
MDERLRQLERRIALKTQGKLNTVQVKVMNRVAPQDLRDMTAHVNEARKLFDGAKMAAAVDRNALAKILTSANRARKAANRFDLHRNNFTENRVINAAYLLARLVLNTIAVLKKRWNPNWLPWNATTRPDGKLNWAGIVKEGVTIEGVMSALRLAIWGHDFNPFNPESRWVFPAELGASAVATLGTLATIMGVRRYTSWGKHEAGRILASAVGSGVFGSVAGFLSYYFVRPSARGGSLLMATWRAFKNSITFRYPAAEVLSWAAAKLGGAVGLAHGDPTPA